MSLASLIARARKNANRVHSVDFRTLYATAAQGWFGVDAEAIVGKGFTPLPILA